VTRERWTTLLVVAFIAAVIAWPLLGSQRSTGA
jgi:hypothetical protein